MKFVTNDGVDLSGGDFREIVRELRRASPLAPERSEVEYMKAVAKRIGGRVRIDTPANFVHDLERLGFLIRKRER